MSNSFFRLYFDRWFAFACVWPSVIQSFAEFFFQTRQITWGLLKIFKISLLRMQLPSFCFSLCLWLHRLCVLSSFYSTYPIAFIGLSLFHFNCISNDNSQHFSFGCCVANGAICKMEIERKNESTRHDVELLGKCLTFFHLPLALVALCAQKYADSFAFFSSSFPFHFWEKWMRVWEVLARAK